ncbi:MAG TPA: glycosyl hydrolase-related protein [Candidatus Acidoferrales bacterium]|nr:glycosyl hydrolase-related protein [Candidatus Acidoferrales bacterium]
MKSLLLVVVSLLAVSRALCQEQGLDVYFTPFSHLDLYWGGTREECLARGNHIIAKAIQLAKRSPEFRFMLEDNDFVANYVESHKGSEELAEFRRLVKEGRIEVAPKWAAIFQSLPDGEVQVRNLIIGKRYARTVFGVDPPVAHLGDLPDYTPQYPQILAKSGVPYAVMTRMGPSDKSLFHWKAPDGSRALVWNTLKGYGWGTFLTTKQQVDAEKIARLKKELDEVRATTDGPILMNWGSDLWAPPDDLVEVVKGANRLRVAHFLLATPADFFRRVAENRNIPEVSGEINTSWPNIVSSLPHLWPLIVPATNTLLTAERFAAINYALGYADYPQQQFDLLWTKSIESVDHNHDGQGGALADGRKQGYSMMSVLMGGEIMRDMLRNIAERVRIPVPKSFPIVVFNPLNWTRDDVVRAHVTLYGEVSPADISAYKKGLRLVDETGKSVPFYVERSSEIISRALELLFIAQGVPSVGYKTYFLVAAEQPEAFSPAAATKLDRENDRKEPRRGLGSDALENEFFKITVDRATGRVSVLDKELQRDVCRDMEIVAIEERGGNYIGIETPTGRAFFNHIHSVELEGNNPILAVVKISGEVAGVPVVQRLMLYRDLRRLDIENTVEWKEPRFVHLEQLFPLEGSNASIHYGIPFGANAAENIMPNSGPHASDEIKGDSWKQARHIHDWIRADGEGWGLTLSADHQFVRLGDGVIRAEMVRGTRFTSVKVERGGEVTSLFYPPNGTYVFRYSLTAGPGDWKTAKAYQTGMEFNNPLLPIEVVDAISEKSLPSTYSFVSLTGENLVLSALKKAESGPDVLLRVYEIEGSSAESPVEFLGQARAFREVNLLEEETGSKESQALRASPYEIKTIKMRAPR